MISIRGRMVRLVSGALLASGAVVAVGIAPAGAAGPKPVALNATCHGKNIETDTGATGTPLLPTDDPFPLPFTTAPVGGPTEVNAGTSFNGVAPTIAVPIPAQVDSKVQGVGIEGGGVVNVNAVAKIIETIQVTGASSVGNPTISGGNVLGATAERQGSNIVLTFPGTHATSNDEFQKNGLPGSGIIPGDEKDFTPGASFSSPKLTIPITAGAAGATIKFKFVAFQADSDADVFDNLGHVPVRAVCVPDANTLGTVRVVTPPPPGAPDAVADVATTDQGKAIGIDVLANDTPNAVLAVDKDSLAVTKSAAHGTTTVNADDTITYTPAAGFAGTDEFTYKLCSVPEAPTTTTTGEVILTSVAKAVAVPCDTAVVTVTVLEPQDTVEAPATTPTTLAAAAELPRTGSSSTPLALLGFGLCIAGFAAAWFAKSLRRNAAS